MLASKNKMHVVNKQSGKGVYVDIPNRDNPYVCPIGCYITFYTKDIDMLEYNFNIKPNHTNFSLSNGYIKGEKDVNKIYIDAQKDFVFYIEHESDKGEVYANAQDGDIEGNYIIYKSTMPSNDYLIREYVRTNTTRYSASVEIDSQDDVGLILNSIYIKEVE